MSSSPIISSALHSIELQAAAIGGLAAFTGESFEKTVQAIAKAKGRLVVSGIGKSAIVAQKIVATMNSTGTLSLIHI